MDSRAKELCRIGSKLKSDKSMWESLCQDIAENFYPARADFTSSIDWNDFAGDLFESYPVLAREQLGNAVDSMLRQGQWFKVGTGDDDRDEQDAVAMALDRATRTMHANMYDRRSNIKKALAECDMDWVAFGNPVMSIEESAGRDHLVYKPHHPRDCAWVVNGDYAVDQMYRDCPMQAQTLVRKRGWTVHPEIKRMASKDPAKKVATKHVVVPAEFMYGDDSKKLRELRGMPFVSVYVDMENEAVMYEGPLPVFNYMVPRWRSFASRPQGFSPATINSLPDGRGLQAMKRIIIEQGEKAVDPAYVAKGEIFRNGEFNAYSGGLTYVDLEQDDDIRKALMTIGPDSQIGVGLELVSDVREMIAESFMLNKLFLPNNRDMREIEVQVRTDEFRRAALPFFSPIESEYHQNLLDITWQMLVAARVINPEQFPEELQGEDISFRFDSPLNTAEGRLRVAAFNESIQIAAASAQFDDTVPSMLDMKKMTRDAIKGTGAEPDWFLPEPEAQEKAAAQERVAALQRTAEALREGAGVAGDVAGASKQMQEAGLI